MQASAPPDSVPSLQNMALLLDRLAKENQDIRLLQAQLQVGIEGDGNKGGRGELKIKNTWNPVGRGLIQQKEELRG